MNATDTSPDLLRRTQQLPGQTGIPGATALPEAVQAGARNPGVNSGRSVADQVQISERVVAASAGQGQLVRDAGGVSLAQLLASRPGRAFSMAYVSDGKDKGKTSMGLELESLGKLDAADGSRYDVVRIRNAGPAAQSVTLGDKKDETPRQITLAANSDTFVLMADSAKKIELRQDGEKLDKEKLEKKDFAAIAPKLLGFEGRVRLVAEPAPAGPAADTPADSPAVSRGAAPAGRSRLGAVAAPVKLASSPFAADSAAREAATNLRLSRPGSGFGMSQALLHAQAAKFQAAAAAADVPSATAASTAAAPLPQPEPQPEPMQTPRITSSARTALGTLTPPDAATADQPGAGAAAVDEPASAETAKRLAVQKAGISVETFEYARGQNMARAMDRLLDLAV